MKKFMASFIAVIMVFTVAGCGSNKPAETTVAGTAAVKTATELDTTAADTAAEGETSGAASSKKYIINIDIILAPFEFENEKGEMVGIDLDILQVIAQDRGFEYEVVPVGFSAVVTVSKAGEYDGVIAGMSITDERMQKYDFSEPYYNSGIGMAVLADSNITSYDQLKDQKVAAKIGTEGCTLAEPTAEQYGFEVTQYGSSSGMYQAVLASEAVACSEDYPVIGYEISRGLGLAFPIPKEKSSSCGFTTLKGANPELVKTLNKGPENIKASGRYDEVLNTYVVK